MNQSQYARHRKISQQRVAIYIRDGLLKGAFTKKGRSYNINAKKADKLLEQNIAPENRPKRAKRGKAA